MNIDDEDEESEGEEELVSESDDDGSDDGCDSNNLGYASFGQLQPVSVLVTVLRTRYSALTGIPCEVFI